MAEQEVVFSDFIAEKIEGEVGRLEARKVTARQAVGELHGVLKAARDRGVPETDLLRVLRENGIRLSPKVFREYMDAGRPGKHVNAKGAAAASKRLNAGQTPGAPADA